jgi:hypothetical protein
MSTLDYSTNLVSAPSVASDLETAWENGLNAAAVNKIKQRWDAIVGSSDLWQKNVANPSNANWKSFVNPDFNSRSGRSADVIKGVQLKKLNLAYLKAQAAHDDQFASGAAKFTEAVTAKKANWTNNVGQTLGMTGDRLLGVRGPASQHVRVATGDLTYLRDAASPASGTFDPTTLDTPQVPYIKPFLRGQFKAAFEGLIIQVGVFLLRGDITEVDTINATLDDLLGGFLFTGTPEPPTQFIHFELGSPIVLHTHLDNDDIEPTP